jgi:hypothetical protein
MAEVGCPSASSSQWQLGGEYGEFSMGREKNSAAIRLKIRSTHFDAPAE